MIDYGHQATEKELKIVESRIKSIYTEAKSDINKKMKDFNARHAKKQAVMKDKLKNGLITKDEYQSWMKGQVFQGNQWKFKKEQIVGTLATANMQALSVVNAGKAIVFIGNSNYTGYMLEHTAGVNFGFGLYDSRTVGRLIKEQPDLLPNKHLDKTKDGAWNRKKITRQVTLGIIEGEGIDDVAKRLGEVTDQNWRAMRTSARTALTSAQNAGRQARFEEAEKKGIKLHKEWMCTFDMHTRDTHRELDGQKVPVNKPFKVDGYEIRFPGDPHAEAFLVYNCRCSMVADLDDFPDVYQRYDNIDGKPVSQMTYKEWIKAKTVSEGVEEIDYSAFGGKETYGIFHKYNDLQDLMVNGTVDETDAVIAVTSDPKKLMELFKDAHDDKAGVVKELTEVEKLTQKKIDAYDALEKALTDKDIDAEKVYSNIWKNDVLLKDWESKKDAIQAKKDYFEAQLKKAQLAKNASDEAKFAKLLDDLQEFDKNGSAMAQYYKAIADAEKELKLAQYHEKLKGGSIFGDEAYTQKRKDAALWAKQKKVADDALRTQTGEVWRNATQDERLAIYEYTMSYSKFNEPLRGIEYGTNKFKGVGNTDLDAGYQHSGKMLNDMTSILDKSTYSQDVWMQRGVGFRGMDKFFNVDEDLLRYGTQEELEDALLGNVVTEYGFMSCGTAKGQGFTGDIMMNVYAPSGTKMMYAEPFSHYGDGDELSWDGISKQRSFGGEFETILQQGTQFRITKIERSSKYDTIYMDIEVINQLDPQLWRK